MLIKLFAGFMLIVSAAIVFVQKADKPQKETEYIQKYRPMDFEGYTVREVSRIPVYESYFETNVVQYEMHFSLVPDKKRILRWKSCSGDGDIFDIESRDTFLLHRFQKDSRFLFDYMTPKNNQ